LPELFHDLREPISAILLLAEVAEIAEIDAGDAAAIRRRLRQIRSEATWLHHLAEASCDGDELRLLDLAEVVADCVERVAITSKARIVVDDIPATYVPAPPVGLRQALTNIICNAARAAGHGGEVCIRLDVEDEVVIHVIDDGPGFGHLPVLHGDGLGIARSSLARFGGRLELASGPDGGTCVSLVLAQRSGVSQHGPA
jgi:signal transduction histidine kinase